VKQPKLNHFQFQNQVLDQNEVDQYLDLQFQNFVQLFVPLKLSPEDKDSGIFDDVEPGLKKKCEESNFVISSLFKEIYAQRLQSSQLLKLLQSLPKGLCF
jgi:hypothetical protein